MRSCLMMEQVNSVRIWVVKLSVHFVEGSCLSSPSRPISTYILKDALHIQFRLLGREMHFNVC